MCGNLTTVLVLGLVGAGGICAGAPIMPADKRIEAAVVATLSAPSEQPMHMPTDMAVDRTGQVFVADGTNDRIVRFAADGKFDLAMRDIGAVKLNRPVGLALDGTDRLWIADTGNHRVVVLSAAGTLLETIPLPALEGGHPFDATDLCVTADGKRTYVVDNDNHRVVVRGNRDAVWFTLGSFGRALGQFQWPFMICLGPDGTAYVTEAVGARVQRISPGDRWAGLIGRWGVEVGQFYRPKGIAADSRGRLYVSDSSLGVVQVFSARGDIEGVLTDPQGRPLHFEHPMGLCFDPAGRLCVVELGADRIAVVAVRPSEGVGGGGNR